MNTRFCLVAALAGGLTGWQTQAASELQALQGTWEGAVVTGVSKPQRKIADPVDIFKDPGNIGVADDKPSEKITITITGDSFRFHRDVNFWFETTITLPADTEPRQLHATIKSAAPAQGDNPIGKTVTAIYKIEAATLTLAVGGGEETPKSFETVGDKGLTIYELRKVQPQNQKTGPPKPK